MEQRKSKSSKYGMFTGICRIIGLGIILGVALGIPFKSNDGWSQSELAALAATGIALAYVILAAIDWALQRLALGKNPLPDDLDLADRAVARERCQALNGNSLLQRHCRRLLAAWAAGASGPQVTMMAANQTFRMLGLLAAEPLAILALLFATAGFQAPGPLLTLGTGLMVLVALAGLARFQLAAHAAGYIESNLLARIGNDTPAAAAADFTKNAAKAVADSMDSLAAAQAKFAEQLTQAQQQATAQLAKAQEAAAAQIAKAQQDAAAQVAKAQEAASTQIAKAQQDAAAQVAKAQQEAAAQAAQAQEAAAAQIAKTHSDVAAKLSATQQETGAQLAKAQDKVAEQLGRVTDVAASVDQVLKLQQAVDGTLKGVTVTDEFKSTLLELKRHLAESDQLLRNAAKPRTIRLVEKDNE
ncbi:MAG TPA: hypothetical protein PLD40_08560 [Kiritimatiellia bacterium]|jgi:hypothetical protein|nr:MAG: hypothetical protein BWX54_01359 [Verrucomicrobia bacterium ADurb.Bin018]HOE37727.1 hypothetical protein [Kiritimatiellia bacterium]HPK70053.1 hypothetical protein [Kiritimatiellia bacterium]HPV47621.1 hypothetical protein [Kiritimatiellia bacterium]HPY61622.1 hypothetical protein [Kiritimatiellia bacterium]